MTSPGTLALDDDELASATLSPQSRARAATLLDEHGFLILPRVFPAERLAAWQVAYAEQMKRRQTEREAAAFPVGNQRFLFAVHLESELADPMLYACPLVLPIIRDLVGDDCILNSTSSVVALPGANLQALHKDHQHLYGDERPTPAYALTLVVPLVPLDGTNGTTRLHDGSHRRPASQSPPLDPLVPLGGCLLTDYRLSHRGTPNRGPRMRPLLYLVYSRPWFLDERNFFALPALRRPTTPIPAEAEALFARADGHADLGVDTGA